METEVTKILDAGGIDYQVVKHENEALTCELAAKERGCELYQIVKTMVAKDNNGGYHVCLIPGNKKLKLKKVKKEAGGLKLQLANPTEIAQELGLQVGAISPLIFPDGTNYYMDNWVLNNEYVDISSGHPKAGIRLKAQDLSNIVGAKVCDIISSNI